MNEPEGKKTTIRRYLLGASWERDGKELGQQFKLMSELEFL
jgi:hypothetical protein